MATLEELKQKALEAAEVIADVSVDLYKKAEVKTKAFAKTAKLQAENASDRTAIKKLYMEIGKLYYETHKLFPEPEFEQNCAEIASLSERITERLAEIEAIKAESMETDAEVEIVEDETDGCCDDDCDCEEHKETDSAE